jgi:hypothetical protein
MRASEEMTKKKHDVRGPSSLARLALCPGSANLISTMKDVPDGESEASIRGDSMHRAMEELRFGADGSGDAAVYAKAVELGLGPGDIDDLSFAIGKAREIYDEVRPDQLSRELPLCLSVLGISGGTADLALINPWQHAHVVDYKFGRYPVTPADRNIQLKAYAAGVADQFAVPMVTVHVIQPALGVHSKHTHKDIQGITAEVRSVIDASKAPAAPRIPGADQCKFCPASAICREAGAKVDEIVSLAPVGDLSLSQLEDAMDKAAIVKAVIGKIEEAMYSHLIMGGESSRWTLSKPRSLRAWKDELDTSGFPPEAFEITLLGPAAVEKKVSKEQYAVLKKHVVTKNSKPSIVPCKGGKGKKDGD